MLTPAWVVLIMAGPAGTGAGGACRAAGAGGYARAPRST